MKFKLIESETGDKNRKLFNQAVKKAKEYFMSLSEQQMINILFDENNSNDITDHSSMFITSNGTILNATDYENDWYPREDQAHIDVFFNAFGKKVQEYLQGTSAENLLTLDSLYDKFITKLFNVQYYCISKFNWIKLNSGTMTDDNNCYITLRDTPNQIQLNAINDYLNSIYCCGHKSVQVWDNDIEPKIYPLDNEDDLQHVKDRIETYCRMGKLYESNNHIYDEIDESYGKFIADKFSDVEWHKKRFDLRGIDLGYEDDLKHLILLLNDVRHETFRVLFCKDYQVIASNDITSNCSYHTTWVKRFNSSDTLDQSAQKSLQYYVDKAKKLNAEQVFILHNHPHDDNCKFSDADRYATDLFGHWFKELFRGHLLVGDTTLTYIPHGRAKERVLAQLTDDENTTKINSWLEHELIGYIVLSEEDILHVAKLLTKPNVVSIAYIKGSDNDIIAIQEINEKDFNNSQIFNYLHNEAAKHGAMYTVLCTTNRSIYDKIKLKRETTGKTAGIGVSQAILDRGNDYIDLDGKIFNK